MSCISTEKDVHSGRLNTVKSGEYRLWTC